jgi:HD-GYP domain-containing protein (c-di-GMP phosphodiesterase class II)
VAVTTNTYQGLFKLRSRNSLIAATVLLQAVVVGLGWWGTMRVARSGISTRLRDQATEQNARAVTFLANAIAQVGEMPLKQGTQDWDEASRLVSTLQIPSSAGILVVTGDGKVLVPSRESRGGNRPPVAVPDPATLANTVVTLLPGRETMLLKELNPGSVVVGEAVWQGAESYIAVLRNDRANVKVIAVQSRASVAAAERAFADGVLFWASLLGLLVLSITIAGSVVLVNNYDTVVMRFNRMLGEEVERRTRRGLAIRNGLVFGLAKLADYRDTDTGKHLERICCYCEMLATALRGKFEEIDRAWIDRLKLASSMHDIGKVGIPDSILLKPGSLTPEERRQMETHAAIGADTLVAIRDHVGDDDLLNMSVEVALCHHEKFDGTGYPNKTSGEQIPLCARIVALADMYDALTSKRVYKAAMSHQRALEIISDNRGKHFDPMVTDAFMAINVQFDEARAHLQPGTGEVELSLLQQSVQQAEEARLKAAA